MKYSLKNEYKSLLKEEMFSLYSEDDFEVDYLDNEEENFNQDYVEISPRKNAILKNKDLQDKSFIYSIENIDDLKNNKELQLNYVDTIFSGRLDNINTSLDTEYKALNTKLKARSVSISGLFSKCFLTAFKSFYISKSLSPKEINFSFNDEKVRLNIKTCYEKEIELLIAKYKIETNGDKTVKINKSHKSFISTWPGESFADRISFNSSQKPYCKSKNKDLFDIFYDEFLNKKDNKLMSFNIQSLDRDEFKAGKAKNIEIGKIILDFYTTEKSVDIYEYCSENDLRQDVSSIKEIIDKLNNSEFAKTSLSFTNSNAIGPGEFACHLLFNTNNALLNIEPDVIFNFNKGKASVKNFRAGGVRTGTTMSYEIKTSLTNLFEFIYKDKVDIKNWNESKFNFSQVDNDKYTENFKKYLNKDETEKETHDKLKKELQGLWKDLKKSVAFEHKADFVICIDETKNPLSPFYFVDKDNFNKYESQINIISCREGRVNFLITRDRPFSSSKINKSFDDILKENAFKKESMLKEAYSYLFKKKIISEGGLAGHMMHPYEALDMTPRQIIDRIKEYSTSQKIIEKVDGQNLFFTVEEDGTLMFARNKEDMTHDDLVEKFTNHPAEVPFVTGGNAIKKGVDQWLSSAGAFGSQEILDIFHPDGEARSFINFEIMHKDHPNQLEYGENFIVFHSIVDFINGREAVYSSNNSQRLNKLINLMKPGIESSNYTLASNRTVDINKLTNVQITHYVDRIKEIANQLDITESEFLGDGVEKQIKKQLDAEGINISDEAIKILYDFALYGEDRLGNKIKSKDFTKLMKPDDIKKLRAINLTSANKAAAKVRSILSPFKDIFVDLGMNLLDGTPSAYMDSETDLSNIDNLRDKLETAIDDLRMYMNSTPENKWDPVVNRLKPHYDKVVEAGVYNTISTSVEGGVYDYQGDLLKVTGGFAPLNQILGAAYRDKKGIFPTFKQKFMKQESNRRSLKSVFNLVY
jgi:hypothetical protein